MSQSAAQHPPLDPSRGPGSSPAAITQDALAAFDEAQVAVLAQRLEDDDYATPFDGLQDWHLLRALAIHRPELVTPWVHLVDQEPFDED